MRRRPHGEGAVYKRGEGWVAVLELDPSVDGRRRRRYLYDKTQREVLDQLATLRLAEMPPKTTGSIRRIALPGVLVDALTVHR